MYEPWIFSVLGYAQQVACDRAEFGGHWHPRCNKINCSAYFRAHRRHQAANCRKRRLRNVPVFWAAPSQGNQLDRASTYHSGCVTPREFVSNHPASFWLVVGEGFPDLLLQCGGPEVAHGRSHGRRPGRPLTGVLRPPEGQARSFNEDQSRLRAGHGAKNMAVVRHFALNLVRQVADKRSIKSRCKRASWDPKYLMEILGPPQLNLDSLPWVRPTRGLLAGRGGLLCFGLAALQQWRRIIIHASR